MTDHTDDNDDGDGVAVVCVRVEDVTRPALPAHMDHCCDCGRDVWQATSTYRYLRTHPRAIVLCRQCAAADAARNPSSVDFHGALPGQVEEIAALLNKNAAELN